MPDRAVSFFLKNCCFFSNFGEVRFTKNKKTAAIYGAAVFVLFVFYRIDIIYEE